MSRHVAWAFQRGQLFTLWDLSGASFQHLGAEPAQLAYLQSYAFIEYLTRHHGERSLRELCATLLRKRDLARAVKQTYRIELEDLEQRFASEYRGSREG